MVKKSFALTVDCKTYAVELLRPGVIAIDGEVFSVGVNGKGVTVDDDLLSASLSEDFAVVQGKLYEVEWEDK